MIKLIKRFFKYIWNWRKHYKIYRLTKKIGKAVESKEKRRLKLKWEVIKMVRKYTKMDKDNVSKYIPLDEATKSEIRFQVDLLYGKEMEHLDVKLNDKLQLV